MIYSTFHSGTFVIRNTSQWLYLVLFKNMAKTVFVDFFAIWLSQGQLWAIIEWTACFTQYESLFFLAPPSPPPEGH